MAEPLLPPLQLTLVGLMVVAVNVGGCVIVAKEVTEHPFESFRITVYVPLDKPLIDEVD